MNQPSQTQDLYKRLNIIRSAPPDVLKAAFRAAAKQWHPDINPGPSTHREFIAVSQAYEVLSNPDRRLAYNLSNPLYGYNVQEETARTNQAQPSRTNDSGRTAETERQRSRKPTEEEIKNFEFYYNLYRKDFREKEFIQNTNFIFDTSRDKTLEGIIFGSDKIIKDHYKKNF